MLNDEHKTKILTFISRLTIKRVIVIALAGVVGLAGLVVYENRQKLFDSTMKVVTLGDFVVDTPTEKQTALISTFMANHPEVLFITLVDADPVRNTRKVIHRFFNEDITRDYFAKIDKSRPGLGDGPLFTDSEANNAQVLSVANGEWFCSSTKGGILEKQFPQIAEQVTQTCRAPLPPAFRKAGGWFSIHLKGNADMASLKIDSLTMSFLYFEGK
jgi:hypothetical protein